MEKHGIGTDATHAEHIETIKDRNYVTLNQQSRFLPGELGLGLVEGYDSMGYEISKPNLRAALEEDLKAVCDGRKNKDEVLRAQVLAYKNVFIDASRNVEKLDEAMSKYFGQPTQVTQQEVFGPNVESVLDCTCKSQMVVRKRKDGSGYFLSCRSYPNCRNSVWFPSSVLDVAVTDEHCSNCMPKRIKKLRLKLDKKSIPMTMSADYTTCIMCDSELKQCLQIDLSGLNRTANGSSSTNVLSARSTNAQTTTSSSRPTFGAQNSPSSNNNNFQPQRNAMVNPVNNAFNNNFNISNNFQRMSTNTNTNGNMLNADDEDNPMMCNCNRPAVMKTVRKDGPNQGRPFFSCSDCSFFAWADGNGSNTNTNTNTNYNSNNNNNNFGGKRKN